MSRAEIISYVKNLLPKIDKTLKYHDNVVAMAIDLAMEQVFHDMYLEDPKHLDVYAKAYETNSATSDTLNGVYKIPFANIGAYPINIPAKARGVIRVFNETNKTQRFIPVSYAEYLQLPATESGYLTSTVWYAVKRDAVVLHNLPTANISDTFTVFMIPKFYDMLPTDTFNFPYGQDQKVMEYVMQHLSYIRPKDLLTNNADANG